MRKQTVKEGDIFTTTYGGTVVVVKYISSLNVIVRHEDENWHLMRTSAQQLRQGCVKNPYAPKLSGVGYVGVGKHQPYPNGVKSKAYAVWCHMLARCYDEKEQMKAPHYIGCSVDRRWHNYQEFAEWYYSNKYYSDSYFLDKDLIKKGNKVYSPELCALVPRELNNLFAGTDRSKDWVGVYYRSDIGRYSVEVGDEGVCKKLGFFDCRDEARKAYLDEKALIVGKAAKKWSGKVDPRVIESLYRWCLSKN